MADVLNLDANHWLECGGRSNADHARERPGRHLDNYGLWSCWLVDRYIPGASSRVVCDRAVRWLFDVDLGRDVPTFSLSVFSALASQRLTNRRARDFHSPRLARPEKLDNNTPSNPPWLSPVSIVLRVLAHGELPTPGKCCKRDENRGDSGCRHSYMPIAGLFHD